MSHDGEQPAKVEDTWFPDSSTDLKRWMWEAKVEWVRTGKLTSKIVDTPEEFAHWIDLMMLTRQPLSMGVDEIGQHEGSLVWLTYAEHINWFRLVYHRE